jgi:DNA-binding beta-propeller fold protein YncE
VGTPKYGPYALTVSPLDGTVWISDNNSGDVRCFDPATQQMDAKKTLFTGGVSMFSAFTSDGKTLYVPHQGDDQLTIIDVPTLTSRLRPIPPTACLNVHMITIAPGGQNALIVCEGDHVTRPGTAVNLSLESGAFTGFVEVGLFPDGATWLPALP